MSTGIEGIKKWLAANYKNRGEPEYEYSFTLGQTQFVFAELEKAKAEREYALDTIKRGLEKWEKLAAKAAARLAKARMKHAKALRERDAAEHERDVLASEIEAANIALDLWDAKDGDLSLVERIEARHRERRHLQQLVRSATAAETLKRLPTISDPEIHEAMMEVERAFSSEEES